MLTLVTAQTPTYPTSHSPVHSCLHVTQKDLREQLEAIKEVLDQSQGPWETQRVKLEAAVALTPAS